MQPPLSEVPKRAPVSNAKPALFGLSVAAGVNVIFSVASFLLELVFNKDGPMLFYSWPFAIFQTSMLSLYALLNFSLWRGANWARWIIIVFAFLCVLLGFVAGPTKLPDSPFPIVTYFVAMSRFLWLIGIAIWLLLPNIAQHFKAPKPI